VTSQAGHEDAITLTQADFQEGFLPKPSYVRASKLYTLNERAVAHRFGALTPTAFTRTQTAICTVLGC
jgi:hypothetical protein